MTRLGKTTAMASGVLAACALSSAAFAQVRTFGPTAPYLVTGRSVAVPPLRGDEARPGYDDADAGTAQQGREPSQPTTGRSVAR